MKYFVKLPGSLIALQLFGCNSIEEAKAMVRTNLDVKRLPKGTEIWEAGKR